MSFRNILLALCTTTLGLSLTPAAFADTSCTLGTIKGTYGYTVVGRIKASAKQPPFQPGPFAAVGRITFDGRGNVSTVRTFSDDGTVITNDSGTGTYTVNSDCSGTFNISVSAPGATAILTLNFIYDDDGQIRAIVTNQGFVLTLEGRRQK